MKGTPFSVACSPVWIAGQVASLMRISPLLGRLGEARREARFAERHRARLDFRHAARADEQVGGQPSTGTPSSLRFLALRRISACTTAIAGME